MTTKIRLLIACLGLFAASSIAQDMEIELVATNADRYSEKSDSNPKGMDRRWSWPLEGTDSIPTLGPWFDGSYAGFALEFVGVPKQMIVYYGVDGDIPDITYNLTAVNPGETYETATISLGAYAVDNVSGGRFVLTRDTIQFPPAMAAARAYYENADSLFFTTSGCGEDGTGCGNVRSFTIVFEPFTGIQGSLRPIVRNSATSYGLEIISGARSAGTERAAYDITGRKIRSIGASVSPTSIRVSAPRESTKRK